ncbi:MAG TPA: DUF29 domain-containing protein [Stellaceae bacterium]|nr:DUF29 domain-containing protein [Stellaceae bacterium]HMD66179.1 DUF29 domain-containing protein [Stellaceae bacterium]
MTMPAGPRWEDDFYAWTQHQAEVLRSMPVSDNRFDREHVVEEIEDLGKSERDAVRSRIRRIIAHFLKLAHSVAEQPRFDWMETIDDARETLSDKLSARLRRDAEANLENLYAEGRKRAAVGLRRHGEPEAAEQLPSTCPWSLDEISREDWYPIAPEPP